MAASPGWCRVSAVTSLPSVRRRVRGRHEVTGKTGGAGPRGGWQGVTALHGVTALRIGMPGAADWPATHPGPPDLSEGDGMLEGMSTRRSSPVLVGRVEQLSVLDAALRRARAGIPSA